MEPMSTGREPAFIRAFRRSAAGMFRRKGRDRGSVLLEAIVSLGLLSALVLGYTTSSVNAQSAQRSAVNSSIASQEAQNAIETVRSTPWAKIGTAGAPVAGLLPTGVAHVTGSIPVTKNITSRGLKLKVNTAVRWTGAKSPTGYGKKTIVIDITWQDNLGNAKSKRRITEPIIMTPSIGEAAPSTVRSGS